MSAIECKGMVKKVFEIPRNRPGRPSKSVMLKNVTIEMVLA